MAKEKCASAASRTKSAAASGKRAAKWQRPRGGPAKSISELMPDIGRAAFRRYGFVQSSVVSRWPEIVGERYAEVSLPEAIRFPRGRRENGILDLVVTGAFATMMQHIAPEIIERVNRFFGYPAVGQVKFRHGTIEARANREPRAKPPPSLKPVPLSLGDDLRDVGDPELAQVLQSLAEAVARTEGPPKLGSDPAERERIQ